MGFVVVVFKEKRRNKDDLKYLINYSNLTNFSLLKHFKINLWSGETAQWAKLATQGRQPEFSPQNPH